jgi:hypothetical protein
MGTRSMVGVMVGDKCRAVYVHWDGYLSGVGAELQEYTTQPEVEALIADGDRSSLTDGFYKDRGERGVAPKTYSSFAKFYKAAEGCWAEYYYIFKDGVWYCGDTYGQYGNGSAISKKLVPYAEAVELAAQEREEEECF